MPQDDAKEWKEEDDLEVVAFLNPVEPKLLTAQQIREMFTDAELDAVDDAIDAGDKNARRIMSKLTTRSEPMLANKPSLVTAVQYLQSKNLAPQKLIDAVPS